MEKLVLFIHGLGGSAAKTWGSFPNLLNSDSEISKVYFIDFYSYPTRLLTLFRKMPRIQSLALGLHTELANRYAEYTDVVLICHSLGGLIARQYLIEEIKRNRPIRVSRLLLYATPNNGADLANIGKSFFWLHYQINQMGRNSEFLDSLNNDWSTFSVGGRVDVTYIIGGLDRIVNESSARGQWGTEHCWTVITKGHRDIVKPTTAKDLAFVIAQRSLLPEPSMGIRRFIPTTPETVEPEATTPTQSQFDSTSHEDDERSEITESSGDDSTQLRAAKKNTETTYHTRDIAPYLPHSLDTILYYGCDDVSAHTILQGSPPYRHGINLSYCSPLNDFGQGFYMTTSLHQAKNWANLRCRRLINTVPNVNAVVLQFNVDRDSLAQLETLSFVTPNTDYWRFVQYGRQGGMSHKPSGGNFDVVYGPVSLWPQILVLKDCDQISFHTARALSILPTPIIAMIGTPFFT